MQPGIVPDSLAPPEWGEIFPKQCAHYAPEPERNTWERWHLAGVLYSGELAGRMPALPGSWGGQGRGDLSLKLIGLLTPALSSFGGGEGEKWRWCPVVPE
jgi:hypothetical protein